MIGVTVFYRMLTTDTALCVSARVWRGGRPVAAVAMPLPQAFLRAGACYRSSLCGRPGQSIGRDGGVGACPQGGFVHCDWWRFGDVH